MLYDGLPGDVCDREHGVEYVAAKESTTCGGRGGAGGHPALHMAPAPWLGADEDPRDPLALGSRPPALHSLRIHEDGNHSGQTPLTEDKADGDVPTRTQQPVLTPFLPFSRETLSI